MATTNGVENHVKPAFELTADDLIRVFNDPDGELHHYDFNINDAPPVELDFIMELPHDRIKAFVEKVRQEILNNFDFDELRRPRFEHVGSTSIEGELGSFFLSFHKTFVVRAMIFINF